MKIINVVFFMLILVSCASPKETNYTASTPAGPVVRSFLGISLTDSVDFIRWKISFNESRYTLACSYGIGKPNTNGFINGGKTIDLGGPLSKEKNIYLLQNGSKTLQLAELNADLLHIMDASKDMLGGTGGWSYTLCRINPAVSDQLNFTAQPTVIKDSMAFEGRTPCGVPGVIAPGRECYKLKWYIVFYPDTIKNEQGTYRTLGTAWRKEGGRKGTWTIIRGPGGRISYQLTDTAGTVLYLLKPAENILLFTDANGKLLVGDEDFSYTLNRKR